MKRKGKRKGLQQKRAKKKRKQHINPSDKVELSSRKYWTDSSGDEQAQPKKKRKRNLKQDTVMFVKETIELEDSRKEPWGIDIDYKTWTVKSVHSNGQCSARGIKPGARLLKVNTCFVNDKTRVLIEEALKRRPRCKLEFLVETYHGSGSLAPEE